MTRAVRPAVPFRHLLAAGARARGPTVPRPERSESAPKAPRETRTPELEAGGPKDERRVEASRREREQDDPRDSLESLLDPSTRHAAQLAPPVVTPHARPETEASAPAARVSMEELVPQLVRRIAWGGDRRKGTVQLELGSGRHAGAIVTVHAEAGRLRVEVQGHEVDELRERIDARLRRHGLVVDSVT